MFKLIVILALSFAVINAWNPPRYRQCDSRWANNILGYGPATICRAGCLMSSVASMVTGCGKNFDPAAMNNWLKSHGGFQGDGYIWAPLSALGFNFQGFVHGTAAVKAAFASGKRVILNVRGGHHWVLAVHDTGSGFKVNDPGDFGTDFYPYDQIVTAGVYSAGCS